MSQTIEEVLKQYWGYDSFRPMQREVIAEVMAGRDTLALMPTGAGKSLTYQVPTLARDGLCIVVTPLIALMKDQVDNLRNRGISAVAVHSGMTMRQIDVALDNCVYGDVKFLYLAPERLATDTFRLRVQRMPVSLLAVDEAHCISQWGYDFRPSYLRIAELRRLLPNVPILALTASATERVADDVMTHLKFARKNILRTSFARPNLTYTVRHVENKDEQLLRVVRNVSGSGIVYVRLRESAEKVATMLAENGISANYYHGGLPHAERDIRQEEWVSGKVKVMVATNAFGMGIDKADVRFVVHYSMCDSLESYYQEAGRAGRDGKRSYAVLLVAPDDAARLRSRFEKEFPPIDLVKSIYERLCAYLQIAIGDGYMASFVFNIYDFCAHTRLYSGTVINALKLLQQNGYLTLTDEAENPARLMFCVSRDDLYSVRIDLPKHDHILRTILRLYNGIFTEFRAIDEMEIATASECKPQEVHEFLKMLWRMHVIRYVPANTSPMIFFDEERLPIRDLYIAPATYSLRKEMIAERFDSMLKYADNATECRSRQLSQYFGDVEASDCGVCDVCIARKKQTQCQHTIEEEIVTLLQTEPLRVKDLANRLHCEPQKIADAVRSLLEAGQLKLDSSGHLHVQNSSTSPRQEN